ncbi:hypothetical protein NCLIV_017230 [Neospora caninum Liverpool]|uniref:Uncharacterized protein n=1 Tax=Neospora caninum (strain Liverpool) TaxID=572307 RepID=F0VDY8_NEOCL|nr:hypothetical protein NCLIV_017230 [Neospora caninum Liverpool]CBZ51931.1 hypothetical protein NCLIV_017230 [Neospora caninum Liverpool]CEL65893.1 TPA: hypothetical protein BN1204_017230 [Neospora caninum Liverpool]|eukprot:XP_003881964.1 hypothetical protein NCLIV_017230 [Neospora caninum Liverpool]
MIHQHRWHSAFGIPCSQKRSFSDAELQQRYEKHHEQKEHDLNTWVACLDALNSKIELLDKERKDLRGKLTEKQYRLFLSKYTGRGEGYTPGESTRATSGEAGESASTSQSSAAAGPTPGGSGSLKALQRKMARLRREVALALKRDSCLRKMVRSHEEKRSQDSSGEMSERERVRAARVSEKWEARLAQLKAKSAEATAIYASLRERMRSLKQQKAEMLKDPHTAKRPHRRRTGDGETLRGSENARNRFQRYGIIVEDNDAQKSWRTRPSCANLSQRTSGKSAAGGLLPGPTTRHVQLTGRPYAAHPPQKPYRKQRCVSL